MYINIGFCQYYILESLLVVVGFTQLYCIFQNLCTSSLFLLENKWSHLESIGFILLFTNNRFFHYIFYDFYTNIEWFEPHSVFQIVYTQQCFAVVWKNKWFHEAKICTIIFSS